MGASRRVQRVCWVSLIAISVVYEAFIVAVTIYYSVSPGRKIFLIWNLLANAFEKFQIFAIFRVL